MSWPFCPSDLSNALGDFMNTSQLKKIWLDILRYGALEHNLKQMSQEKKIHKKGGQDITET
jgi:hypothetical protein